MVLTKRSSSRVIPRPKGLPVCDEESPLVMVEPAERGFLPTVGMTRG